MYTYFVPLGVSPKLVRSVFRKQEEEDNPRRNFAFLDDPKYFGGICKFGQESFRYALETATKGTILVLWDFTVLDMSFAELKDLAEKKKFDSVRLRVLHPKMEIDFRKPESVTALAAFAQIEEMKLRPPKKVAEPIHKTKGRIERLPYSVIQKIRYMKATGKTALEIADEVGVSKFAVYKYIKGIDLLPYKNFQEETATEEKVYRPVKDPKFNLAKIQLPSVPQSTEFHRVFVEFVHNQRSDKTKHAYWVCWRDFVKWFIEHTGGAPTHWDQIERQHAREYLVYLHDKRLAPATITNKALALSSFFTYLQYEGLTARNIWRNLKKPLFDSRSISYRPFEPDELQKIFEEAIRRKRRCQKQKRMHQERKWHRTFLTFLIMARTGARISAVTTLEKQDLNATPYRSTLLLREKNNSQYRVPVDRELVNHIFAFIEKWCPADPGNYRFLFPEQSPTRARTATAVALKRMLEDLGISAGHGKIGCHSFRATFATQCYLAKMPLEEIRTRLNHKSIEQTASYIRFALEEPDLGWMPEVSNIEDLNKPRDDEEPFKPKSPRDLFPVPGMNVEVQIPI